MFKRIIALLLAAALLLLCFGCGEKQPNDPNAPDTDIADDSKIALIVGNADQSPELAAAADKLSALYGDALVVLGFPANYADDETALTDVADKAAQDEKVKVVIFADGVNGTAKAAARVRELRQEMCIVVCNPLEGVDRVRLTANLVFSLDFAAFADAMVQNAKAAGAETFVFYTTDRALQFPVISDLRTAVESGCRKNKLTCKAASQIDVYEKDRTIDMAKQYIADDVERKLEKYGEKTAMFSTEPLMQGALAGAAAVQKLYVASTFWPSPIALAAGLGLDLTDHETDSAFALQTLQDAAAENGTKGRVSTWSFSEPVVALLSAMDYAVAVTRGDAGLKVDPQAVDGYVRAHTDADFTFTESGFNNVYLFNSALVTL